MDLTVRTGLSKEDFITLMTNMSADTSGFFEENASLIYDYCEQYQINEIFFCGLIVAESGWNIAPNHRKTHNYISEVISEKTCTTSGVIKYTCSICQNTYRETDDALGHIESDIKIVVEANTKITVSGANKQAVGDVAAEIRSKRPPEVYKGKGIKYAGEYIRRKAGKTGKK